MTDLGLTEPRRGDTLCVVGGLSPFRGFCFVAMMNGGCTPVCKSGSPSDFSFVRLLYVREGLQFATRYINLRQSGGSMIIYELFAH